METVYDTDDYVMAREIPGRVSFTKLVTAEVSIDVATDTPDLVKLAFLVKNDELPLNANNHCRQIFELLRAEIAHNYDWSESSGVHLEPKSEVDLPTAATLSTILN